MISRFSIFFLSLVMAAGICMAAAGCAPAGTTEQNSDNTEETTTAAATSPSETASDDNLRPDAPCGVLRLWWTTRTTLNPLLDSSESGMAANRLVYEGLFSADTTQKLMPTLAERFETSGDGKKAVVTLAAGRTFHDGSAVTAADVKACIDFILTHAAQSPYAAGLNSIASVVVTDDLTLEINLSSEDPWLAYRLSFPVIPAASLAAGAFSLVPGTGSFKMTAYSAETGLQLTRVEPAEQPSDLVSITLLEFSSLNEAMKGFEDDKIDLVHLPAEVYDRYYRRDSLRFEQYTGSDVIVLAYNTKQKHPLADQSRLLFLKRLLSATALAEAGPVSQGENSGVPLPYETFLLENAAFGETEALDSLDQAEWTALKSKLRILLPENDSIRSAWADRICACLDEAGITWTISSLPSAEFSAAILAGSFDLALLDATLPLEPDCTWLYSDSRPAGFAILNEVTAGGLPDYDQWRSRLTASLTLTAMRGWCDVPVMAENLFETAVRSPWSVLQIRSEAILYGDRVVGQSKPDRYDPYNGIEELWIWSGQSS